VIKIINRAINAIKKIDRSTALVIFYILLCYFLLFILYYCMHRKRAAFHSSTSSSSDSDDEERFERRKSRSMAMARQRCVTLLVYLSHQQKLRNSADLYLDFGHPPGSYKPDEKPSI